MDLSGQASSRANRFTNLVHLAEVDSTNSYAAAALREGAPDGLVVVADRQLAGRGRKGRSWYAPEGSGLLCSIGFRPGVEVEHFHLLSSIVALGAIEAIEALGDVRARIKWPNDLLVSGKKVAGLLAELVGDVAPVGVVVGIGINLSWPAGWPENDSDPEVRAIAGTATTLATVSERPIERDELLSEMLAALDRRYEMTLSRRFGAVMDEYRLACSTIGREVEVVQQQQRLIGRAVTVADDGRLVLEQGARTVMVEVGDVVHLHERS